MLLVTNDPGIIRLNLFHVLYRLCVINMLIKLCAPWCFRQAQPQIISSLIIAYELIIPELMKHLKNKWSNKSKQNKANDTNQLMIVISNTVQWFMTLCALRNNPRLNRVKGGREVWLNW